MGLRRSRPWVRARASLAVALVALVAVLALVASSLRAPVDTAIGVAFARARAAEAAATEQSQSRLRVDREDSHVGEVRSLAASPDAAKTPAPPPERDHGGAAAGVAALLSPVRQLLRADGEADPGVWDGAVDPPTRARAKLMVFLN